MTNKSINLIKSVIGKSLHEREEVLRQIVGIEYSKIKAQTNIVKEKIQGENEFIEKINLTKNDNELFEYLNQLSAVDIILLTAYGIDVAFMNLKVSD